MPLIVEESTRTVIEGNRRLAALRIIANHQLQQRFKVTLPEPLHPNAKPDEIQVNYVGSRNEARDFIGFKHVNGAFKWDSYAKAKFAHSWLQDGDDIDEVSRRLGDGHNTVCRLVNGVVVLEQAEKAKLFDRARRSKKSISVCLRMITRYFLRNQFLHRIGCNCTTSCHGSMAKKMSLRLLEAKILILDVLLKCWKVSGRHINLKCLAI